MLLSKHLDLNALKTPDKEAIVFIEKCAESKIEQRISFTWKELCDYSNRVSNMLIKNNIKKGDRIAILIKNTIWWLPFFWGVLKVGAVVVPINHNNSMEENIECMEYIDCKGVFISESDACLDYFNTKQKLDMHCFVVRDSFKNMCEELRRYPAENIDAPVLLSDEAAIYFSSGTTGRQKAVLLLHRSLIAAAYTELSHHGQRLDDIFLCVTPLYHTGSIVHWFGSLLTTGTAVFMSPTSPNNILRVIVRERISIVWLLVPQIQDLLDSFSQTQSTIHYISKSSLRLVHSGAQIVPLSLIKRWNSMFSHIIFDSNYGLTEATGPGCIHLGKTDLNVGVQTGVLIGRADPLWSVNIVDENDNFVASGTIGELVLRGPGVMAEYYNDKEATEEIMRNGWLHTGDLAYIAPDKRIYLVGRKKDVIISGGENIYPVQIEHVIRKSNIVKDVAVVGLSNQIMGELVVAVVELKMGEKCNMKSIWEVCESLPQYKRPARIFFGEVKRNKMGKINKEYMKFWVESHLCKNVGTE